VLGVGGPATAAPDQVKIDSGVLQGVEASGVLSFKGVPFAAPPVGTLRWRAPQPVTPWTGVRDAVAYGHDCMQKPFAADEAPLATAPAEDCLVLNVERPAGKVAGKLPVMVWIYGGGFVNGGSSPAVYSGAGFAKQGVEFVSFNYRLGRFGFFGFPALTKEAPDEPHGNYGYLDQIAALKWVKRNIASFGGDPRNVTIFGESAGGESVHMLLASPMARGLFHKAIIESGGGRTFLMGARLLSQDQPNMPSAEAIGVNFAKSVGIEGDGPGALAKLRALSAEQVTAGLNIISMMGNRSGTTTYAGPMVDGRVVLEDPETAYQAGHLAKVPLIVGANAADIGFSTARTVDEALAPFGPNRDAALAAYDPEHAGDVHVIGSRVAMDKMMVEPARFTAAAFAGKGLAAYEYRFTYVAESARQKWKSGAPHATEIPYVFDTVAARYGDTLMPADEAVAKTANAYWVNFARTGDPNGHGLPKWPRYEAGTDELIDFGADGHAAASPDPWKARLDATAGVAGGKG
jgi:para-nitrobenzyl esterase